MKKNKLIPKCQIGTLLPTAPAADKRYLNGIKFKYNLPSNSLSSKPVISKVVKTNNLSDYNRGEITLTIYYNDNGDNDTVYTETPPIKFPVRHIVTRHASSIVPNKEYQILKRRFDDAWKVSMPKVNTDIFNRFNRYNYE